LRVEQCGGSHDGNPSEAEEAVNALEQECLALKAVLTRHALVAAPKQGN
jgi:hypothetical protein